MAAISWKSGVGGDWATAADWSSGTVPGAGDDVTIGAAGTYTVTINEAQAAHSLAVKASGVTVLDNSALSLGGSLAVTAGLFQLNSTGLISGGTLSAVGGAFVWNGGTISGVTYDGTLDLSAQNSLLFIGAGGLTAKNTAGSGPGAISATGTSSRLIFTNNQTLDNATVNIGGNGGYATIQDYDIGGGNHTLTFGSGLTINQTGADAQLSDTSGYAGDGFVNNGVITAAINGGQFQINSQSFANQGSITVSDGDTLSFNGPSWSNTGAITANGATLRLNGAFTSASLAKITNKTSTVIVGGTVTNSAPALAVGSGTKLGQLTLTGTINGGAIKDAGAGFVWGGGTLSGVTYDGTLDMSAQNARLYIGSGGLIAKNAAGTGPGTINVTGTGSSLIVVNNQTLDKATVNLGGNGGYATIQDYDTNGANLTLTFGSGLTINQTGADAQLSDTSGYTGDGFVNNGAINASVGGGQFVISSQSFANQGTMTVSDGDTLSFNGPSWSNTGAITANGATLRLNGAFTSASLAKITNKTSTVIVGGTVTNSAPALAVGSGTKLGQLTLTGTINGGAIKDAGAGFVWGGGTLSGVTYDGTLDMSAQNARLYIGSGGLIAKNAAGTGPGTINVTGTGSSLILVNNQTLDKATVNLGGNGGYATIQDYDVGGGNHTLTFGSGLTINQTGADALLNDASGYTGDGFVNDGNINAGIAGGRFVIQSQSFDNEGAMTVSGGDLLLLQPTTLTNFSFGTLTGGTYEADAGSTFQLANNEFVTTLDATVILNGAGSTLESLNTTGNAQTPIDATLNTLGKTGTLEVLGGRDWTSTQSVTSAGTLILGGGAFQTAGLNNTGTVSGYGAMNTTVTNHGVVAAAAAQVLSFAGGALTNLTGTTLTGGQFTVGAGGVIQLVNNVEVVTDNALIALTGAGSEIQSFSTSTKAQVTLETTMTSIAASGTLEVLGGRNWSSTNAMTSAGTLMLGGGAFASAGLTSTGTVTGFGVIDTVFNNNGALVVAASQTLSLVGGTLKNLSGTTLTGGVYTAGSGATLQLANNTTIVTLDASMSLNKGSVVQALNTSTSAQVSLESTLATIGATGELDVLGARGYTTTNAIANSGVLRLAGGTFAAAKLTEQAGSTLTGSGTVAGAVANAGMISVTSGTLAFSGAVTGTGGVSIAGGTASFASTFSEAVAFNTSGTLMLGNSQAYAGKISGFSLTGATSLDLRDIGFVSASEATYSGTTSGGVLTVSDGSHTARLNLVGDYTGSTFTAASDGSGGVIVTDPTPETTRAVIASPQAFVTAMSTMSPRYAALTGPLGEGPRPSAMILSLPHADRA